MGAMPGIGYLSDAGVSVTKGISRLMDETAHT